MSTHKRSATLAHIRQLCCLGLPSPTLMPALLRAVREYIGADSAGFFWVNAKGDMTNLYAERMLPPKLMKLYFERHYDGIEHPFRQAFLQRLRDPEPVTSLTPAPSLINTEYYHDILRHLDAHHTMYAVIREQASALGQLSLYRPRKALPFNGTERADLKRVTQYVAHAVSAVNLAPASDAEGRYFDGEHDAVVVIDGKHRIASASAPALTLLTMATRSKINRQTHPLAVGDRVPSEVAALCDRLSDVATDVDTGPPVQACETGWGRFVLRAYALADKLTDKHALIAIQIRRQEPLVLRLAEAMHRINLPHQQREVALLIAQGKSNQAIAASLRLSGNTASYHIRQLFHRLDAHDRASVLDRILAGKVRAVENKTNEQPGEEASKVVKPRVRLRKRRATAV